MTDYRTGVTSTGAGYRAVLLVARLDELERKFEENPRRYFAPLANEYRKAGEPQRAADLCRSQLPEIPGHISGHIVLGQSLYDAGDFPGSRAALETALALDPENIVALNYLGDIARDTGDAVEAEHWYSRTLQADPYNEPATLGLQLLRESGAAQPAVSAASGTDAAAESLPATDSVATGFEPTSHVAEEVEAELTALSEPPEPRELATPPKIAELAELPEPPEPLEVPAPPVLPELAEATPMLSEVASQPPVEEVAPASAEETSQSPEFTGDLEISATAEPPEPAELKSLSVEAHATPEPLSVEEAIEAEVRVMESAAPFVTETMADLYMEQGYPHEALELLLQLALQRPPDDHLRVKIERVESVIAARRDAAVAAARAERAETADAAQAAAATELSAPAIQSIEGMAPIEPPEPEEAMVVSQPPEAPFDPAVAEVDSSAFAADQLGDAAVSFEMHPFEATSDAPISVREMFARMDRARPRPAVTPRPIARLRSDFVAMPETTDSGSDASGDSFAFPDAPARSEAAPSAVPRTSGPHPTFNPSTAPIEDFDAWLRGLKGP